MIKYLVEFVIVFVVLFLFNYFVINIKERKKKRVGKKEVSSSLYYLVLIYGIDINKVTVSEPDKDNVVKITIPEAQVLSANIDEDSISTPLTDKGFLTSISTEEKVETLNKTQSDMKGKAEKDNEMLIRAKERAKTLLEEYIKNVGESIGEDYTVEWKDAEPSESGE